ncbi:MAG: ribonuclease P protein component [Christensenellales bacterium]
MLSKKFRMKKNSVFAYTFKRGQSYKQDKLVLVVAHKKKDLPKIGLVVSKKIGNSVTRNRVKRVIRASVYPELLNIKPDLNLIFVARQGIETLGFNEVNNSVKDLLKKSNAYIEK